MQSRTNLQPIEGGDGLPTFGAPPAEPSAEAAAQLEARRRAASEAVFLALKALSQRAIIAVASLVDLLLIGSVFALGLMIIDMPTPPQLIGVGGYAIFIMACLYLRRRGRNT